MKVPTRVISSMEEAKRVMFQIYPNGVPAPEWKIVGLDSEFKKESNGQYVIFYLQISNGKEVLVIDGPGTSRARGTVQDLLVKFGPWLNDRKVGKIISTVSAEYRALRQYAIIRGVLIDTEVGDWLLDENRREHGLKACARDHLDLLMHDYKDVFGFLPPGKKKVYVPSMDEIVNGSDKFSHMPWSGEDGRKKAEKYAALDPYASYLLGMKQVHEIEKIGMWDWYRQVERPFTLTLIRMEDRGIKIDLPTLMVTRRKVQDSLLRKRHLFRALVDDPSINLGSGKQLSKLFFDDLGWPPVVYTKKSKSFPKGKPSLNKEALAIYAEDDYELAKLLQSYRLDATQNSTFLEGMYNKLSAESLLYTVFHQARVVTGRLSSGRAKEGLMNLQNIPAQKDHDPYQVRKLFIPTKPGYTLIVGDYSQIELYILAQLSKDKVMCDAFNNGEDLHILTACKIFNLKYPGADKSKQEEFKEQYKKQRGAAKTVNFGLNYGMSGFTLAKRIKVEKDEAEQYVDAYFDLYKGVKHWVDATVHFAHQHGFVKTVAGYTRHLGDWINSGNDSERSHAERQAMNSPIQGTASQIIKVAMNTLEFGPAYHCKWLPENIEGLENLEQWGVEQLLQVHDEIVLQCPEQHAEEATSLVKYVMESSFKKQFTEVTIKASVSHAGTWYEAKG